MSYNSRSPCQKSVQMLYRGNCETDESSRSLVQEVAGGSRRTITNYMPDKYQLNYMAPDYPSEDFFDDELERAIDDVEISDYVLREFDHILQEYPTTTSATSEEYDIEGNQSYGYPYEGHVLNCDNVEYFVNELGPVSDEFEDPLEFGTQNFPQASTDEFAVPVEYFVGERQYTWCLPDAESEFRGQCPTRNENRKKRAKFSKFRQEESRSLRNVIIENMKKADIKSEDTHRSGSKETPFSVKIRHLVDDLDAFKDKYTNSRGSGKAGEYSSSKKSFMTTEKSRSQVSINQLPLQETRTYSHTWTDSNKNQYQINCSQTLLCPASVTCLEARSGCNLRTSGVSSARLQTRKYARSASKHRSADEKAQSMEERIINREEECKRLRTRIKLARYATSCSSPSSHSPVSIYHLLKDNDDLQAQYKTKVSLLEQKTSLCEDYKHEGEKLKTYLEKQKKVLTIVEEMLHFLDAEMVRLFTRRKCLEEHLHELEKRSEVLSTQLNREVELSLELKRRHQAELARVREVFEDYRKDLLQPDVVCQCEEH